MPFKSRAQNYAEIIDESSIFIVMYHMFCFTDWLDDAEMKNKLGYSAIGFILFHLFCYLTILFSLYLRVKIQTFRIYMYKRMSRNNNKKSKIHQGLKKAGKDYPLRKLKMTID